MKRFHLLLLAPLILTVVATSAQAATTPPQGAVDVAQAYLTMSQTGPHPKREAVGTTLGPGFRLYRGNTKRISKAGPNAKLLDAFSPSGWIFLTLDENGKGHAILVVRDYGDGWKWSSFGRVGSQQVQDLDEMSRRLPEQAVARGVEQSRMNLSVLHWQHTYLLVASDGQREQAAPLGKVEGRDWRKGEPHTSQEAFERLQEVIRGRPAGFGGGGSAIPQSFRPWGLGVGALALVAVGVYVWRRRTGTSLR